MLEELDMSAEKVADATRGAMSDYSALSSSERLEVLEEAEDDLQSLVDRVKDISSLGVYARMNPTVFAAAAGSVSTSEIANALGASVDLTRKSVQAHIEPIAKVSPVLGAVLEITVLALPAVCMLLTFVFLRKARSGAINYRTEAILFGHIYWFGYYLTLSVFCALFRDEPPLVVFAHNRPREYTVFQVVVFIGYLFHTGLVVRHLYVERGRFAAAQVVGTCIVLLSSYINVVYPAMMEGVPPTCGAGTFAFFAFLFAWMVGLIREERKGKAE